MDTVKDKEGKARMGLILPHAAEALVRVREYGLKKYPDANNWKHVPKEDWLDALMRHLMKYIAGQKIDSESGLPHLHHALANLSYMIEGENDVDYNGVCQQIKWERDAAIDQLAELGYSLREKPHICDNCCHVDSCQYHKAFAMEYCSHFQWED